MQDATAKVCTAVQLDNGEQLPTLQQYLDKAKSLKTRLILELKAHKTPGQVVDGGAFGCQTDKLLGGMLGEGDIFRTVLQPFVLYHFYDALYGSCFLFGGLVGFQFEE